MNTSQLQAMAHAIRFLSVDAIVRAGEGHQGAPLGMAEMATVLYARHLKFDAADPRWPDRDRVVLSNGHGSMLLYALQALTGNARITLDELRRFRELGSHCPGHPERDLEGGIEVTTGLLGQGIGHALGLAIAEAALEARHGGELVDHRTWAFVGDGCLQEGVGQEMIALAGHLRLGKLTLLWDDNRITDDGDTALSISEDVAQRFRVAGWHVQEIDGHDLAAIDAALAAVHHDPRPSLIAGRTTIASGIERLEGRRGGHSAKLFESDAQAMRTRYQWPAAAFEVPREVLAEWRSAGRRGEPERRAWQARWQALEPAERRAWARADLGTVPADAVQAMQGFAAQAGRSGLARGGIQLSADLRAAAGEHWPEMFVACADLEAPTDHKRTLTAFTAADRKGRYLHCGVREHAMAALAVGLAAHGGLRPVSVTYLAFVDYQRPSVRMAALMGMPVIFVFSHDSIGVGRNGATHQPVETLASLRSMPNLRVLRPADAVEAAECWVIASEHLAGPTALILSRQVLPLVRGDDAAVRRSARGAYVLCEASGGSRRVTLLATGSEVALALAAREQLQARGVPTAVVSMPGWDLFEQQDLAYQCEVLGPGTVRVGVEAAGRFGWDRWLGERGAFVGMPGFGASGSPEALYAHFGITAEAVVAAALDRLAPESAGSTTKPGDT